MSIWLGYKVNPVSNSSPAIAGLETLRGRSPSGAEPERGNISNGVNGSNVVFQDFVPIPIKG